MGTYTTVCNLTSFILLFLPLDLHPTAVSSIRQTKKKNSRQDNNFNKPFHCSGLPFIWLFLPIPRFLHILCP